mmetsp:Transcript_55866/g.179320  ORF Transcript_55866/g.179320 Transcript_55866/m.179320 type:complete len:88 (+) Transcript_55866:51-314(+)
MSLASLCRRAPLLALLSLCAVARAAETKCPEGVGYSECGAEKDLSTIVSLAVGLLGSYVVAQVTGLDRQSAAEETAGALFSVHALWL